MAIFHLTANIISRGRGQSAVAAAAYRAGAVLFDQRYGITHNYRGKRGVVHCEIMAPPAAPDWVRDREALWNHVEARELRRDAQLARLIELGLPIELSAAERVTLVRDYLAREFVARGMVADFCIRGDGHNPHAHILLTLRSVTAAGFGPKERRWNGKSALLEWRCAWAERANEHLAHAGHAVRIDHRTLDAQQIELTPGRRIGVARTRRTAAELPPHLQGRMAEQQRIAEENGRLVLDDPTVALRALTHQRPSFTQQDLAQFLRSRTGSPEQFDAALLAVMQCADLVVLESTAGESSRFTSRGMLEAEASLRRRAASMMGRPGHGVAPERHGAAAEFSLDEAQRHAFEYLVSQGDAKAVAIPERAKGALLRASCRAWSAQGFSILGAAPSPAAARQLEAVSGIGSQSLAQREEAWRQARERLSPGTVLLLDGCHLLDVKQFERVLAVADKARAKAALIGDSEQLQAMRVESPFRTLCLQIGGQTPPKAGPTTYAPP